MLWAKRSYVDKDGQIKDRLPVFRTVAGWAVTVAVITIHIYKDGVSKTKGSALRESLKAEADELRRDYGLKVSSSIPHHQDVVPESIKCACSSFAHRYSSKT